MPMRKPLLPHINKSCGLLWRVREIHPLLGKSPHSPVLWTLFIFSWTLIFVSCWRVRYEERIKGSGGQLSRPQPKASVIPSPSSVCVPGLGCRSRVGSLTCWRFHVVISMSLQWVTGNKQLASGHPVMTSGFWGCCWWISGVAWWSTRGQLESQLAEAFRLTSQMLGGLLFAVSG